VNLSEFDALTISLGFISSASRLCGLSLILLGDQIMVSMSRYVACGFVAAAALVCAPAQATTQIADGTVSVVVLANPAVNLGTGTFTASNALTFETSGNGGFATVGGGFGLLNGVLNFSSTVGTTLADSVSNFFSFSDGVGGSYKFSVDSVTTLGYSVSPAAKAVTLYLLGSTLDSSLGLDATPTSLTLSFNSTGGSPYSASATLAVPPAPMVPEPATWGMMLVGFGAMGAMMRRRKTSVSFA
jgi:hypothetical protein